MVAVEPVVPVVLFEQATVVVTVYVPPELAAR